MADAGAVRPGGFIAGLDYPMFVVTTATHGGERAGCLVGFATQTSIDPFRFLVFLSKRNRTYRVASAASYVAVHALGKDQVGLAVLFGSETGDEVDKFARCEWREGPEGVPLLAGCPRRLVGEVLDRFDAGDHTGLLLAPVGTGGGPDDAGPGAGSLGGEHPGGVSSEGGSGAPLMFSDLPDIEPGHPA